MKLAEALAKRKILKTEIQELKERAAQYSSYQEGGKKLGDVGVIIEEINEKIFDLEGLIQAINWTNTHIELANTKSTIMQALAHRDMLKLKKSVIDYIVDACLDSGDRYGRNEIRKIPTIEVEGLRKVGDSIAKEYRELDAKIQTQNWNTKLSEPGKLS